MNDCSAQESRATRLLLACKRLRASLFYGGLRRVSGFLCHAQKRGSGALMLGSARGYSLAIGKAFFADILHFLRNASVVVAELSQLAPYYIQQRAHGFFRTMREWLHLLSRYFLHGSGLSFRAGLSVPVLDWQQPTALIFLGLWLFGRVP